MKRVLLASMLLVGLLGLSVGSVPILVGTDPAPHEAPSTWACYPTCVLPVDIVAGDFFRDGWVDLAVLCQATGQVDLYQNQALGGPGIFLPSLRVPGAGATPRFWGGLDAAFTDDGVFVLYEPTVGTSLVEIASRSSSPTGTSLVPISAGSTAIESADLNHDLRLDLIVLDPAGVTVFFNLPSGWTASPLIPLPGAAEVAIDDMNQDGWVDIVVAASTGTVQVLWNACFAQIPAFVASPAIASGLVSITGLGLGDFNGDGLTDYVVAGTNPPAVGGYLPGMAQVFLNTLATGGVIGFTPASTPMQTWGFDTSDVVVFDADGNGRDDFAVSNWGSDTVSVFLSNATPLIWADQRATRPEFCLPSAQMQNELREVNFYVYKLGLHCGHYPIALAAADFDHNGKIDLAVALQSSDEEICPQNPSCIEIIFDPACGFLPSGMGAPAQLPHQTIPDVKGENKECTPCPDGNCGDNKAPDAEIEGAEESGK